MYDTYRLFLVLQCSQQTYQVSTKRVLNVFCSFLVNIKGFSLSFNKNELKYSEHEAVKMLIDLYIYEPMFFCSFSSWPKTILLKFFKINLSKNTKGFNTCFK